MFKFPSMHFPLISWILSQGSTIDTWPKFHGDNIKKVVPFHIVTHHSQAPSCQGNPEAISQRVWISRFPFPTPPSCAAKKHVAVCFFSGGRTINSLFDWHGKSTIWRCRLLWRMEECPSCHRKKKPSGVFVFWGRGGGGGSFGRMVKEPRDSEVLVVTICWRFHLQWKLLLCCKLWPGPFLRQRHHGRNMFPGDWWPRSGQCFAWSTMPQKWSVASLLSVGGLIVQWGGCLSSMRNTVVGNTARHIDSYIYGTSTLDGRCDASAHETPKLLASDLI